MSLVGILSLIRTSIWSTTSYFCNVSFSFSFLVTFSDRTFSNAHLSTPLWRPRTTDFCCPGNCLKSRYTIFEISAAYCGEKKCMSHGVCATGSLGNIDVRARILINLFCRIHFCRVSPIRIHYMIFQIHRVIYIIIAWGESRNARLPNLITSSRQKWPVYWTTRVDSFKSVHWYQFVVSSIHWPTLRTWHRTFNLSTNFVARFIRAQNWLRPFNPFPNAVMNAWYPAQLCPRKKGSGIAFHGFSDKRASQKWRVSNYTKYLKGKQREHSILVLVKTFMRGKNVAYIRARRVTSPIAAEELALLRFFEC